MNKAKIMVERESYLGKDNKEHFSYFVKILAFFNQ